MSQAELKHEFTVELVEKDIRGDASENDLKVLRSNPSLWREHIVTVLARVDATLASKKAQSHEQGYGNRDAISEYQMWKHKAVHFRSTAIRKLGEVKRLLPAGSQQLAPILEDILQELIFIADLLRDNIAKGAANE